MMKDLIKKIKPLQPKIKEVLSWSILVLLFFIPLYLKFPLTRIQGTFVAIRLEDVLIAIVYFLWLIDIILDGNFKVFFRSKINQLLLLFFFIGTLSTFSAIFLTKTVQPHLGILHLLRRVEYMLLLPLTYWVINSKRQALTYLGGFSLVAFIVNLYAFGQKYFKFPVISTTNSELSKGLVYYLGEFDRISSTFAGHYDLAVFLVLTLCLITCIFFYFWDRNSEVSVMEKISYSVWLFFLGSLSLAVLIMTAARLSFVAAIFGIAISLLLVGKKKFILLMGLAIILFFLYPSQLRDRFISTFTVNIQRSWTGYFAPDDKQRLRSNLNIPTLPTVGTSQETRDWIENTQSQAADITPGEPVDTTDLGVYRSFDIRIKIEWPRAIRAYTKNPLLGTGYSSIGLATDNDILRLLGEVGILGAIAFFLILIEIIKNIWSIYRSQKSFLKYFSAGTLAMVFAFLVNSLFIDVFEASKVASVFWIILGINLGLKKIDTT